MSLKSVEDWLECMQGLRAPDGQPHDLSKDFWNRKPAPIKLATYDGRFVESVVGAIKQKKGLTDKQVLLAVKVITKYKRQWSQLGLDPSYLETGDVELRLPIREVDRTTSITREDRALRLRFPYKSNLIQELHNLSGRSCGGWEYDREGKSWIIDMTEGNILRLIHCKSFHEVHWNMEPEIAKLFDDAKELMGNPRGLPTVDLQDGALIYENVHELALESIRTASTDGSNIFIDILVAQRHGLVLGENIKRQLDDDHAMKVLLGIGSASARDNDLGRNQIKRLMGLMPQAEFTFLVKNRRARDNIFDTALETNNEVTYIERLGDIDGISMYDPRKNILCLDVGSINANHTTDCDRFLAVLHINSDDGK